MMAKSWAKKFILGLIMIVGIVNSGGIIRAVNTASSAGFTVAGQPNDTQLAGEGYNLELTPNQTTTLTLAVKNLSNQAATYTIAVNPATTSDNAVIDYAKAVNKTGGQLSITNMAKPSVSQLSVPANSSESFTVNIKMTGQSYDGIVAGGIRVERVSANHKNGVTNKFAFVKGIMLRQNATPVMPSLKAKSVKVGTYHYKPSVTAILENPSHINISGLMIAAKIKNDRTGRVVQTKNITDGNVAPSSSFKFVFRQDVPLPAGKYHLIGIAKDQAGHQWQWDEPFVVTQTAAAKNTAIRIKQSVAWWWPVIVILLLVIFGLLWWIFISKRRKEQADEETSNR
jgi:hypothetical protein